MRRNLLGHTAIAFAALCLAASAALSQGDGERPSLACRDNDNSYSDSRARTCQVKEQTVAAGGTLNVDGAMNGGIAVKGSQRSDILVRYKIQTQAATQAEADNLASQVRVTTAGGQVRAEGPEQGHNSHWSVSYEIFVPTRTDLSLRTHNGGISISDVRGQVSFEAQNGGVSLRRMGGNVTGHTVNGGLSVELAGSNWEGEGLNVKTSNGGLSVSVPENYSARLETGTVNGRLQVSPSIAEVARDARQLALDLGSGGTSLRIFTTNGGVTIKRR